MREADVHAAIHESYRADNWGGEREAKNARDGRAHEIRNMPAGDGRWVVERKDSLEEAQKGRYERLYVVLAYRIEPAVRVVPAGSRRR